MSIIYYLIVFLCAYCAIGFLLGQIEDLVHIVIGRRTNLCRIFFVGFTWPVIVVGWGRAVAQWIGRRLKT